MAAPRLARARNSVDVDVVVVGAGAAGLAAAKELRALGKSVTVCEARDRIGGRAFTDTSLGVPFDAGAAYIHWAERNPWLEIARQFGAMVQEDRWGGSPPVAFAHGRRVGDAERARRRGAFGRLSSLIEERTAAGGDASFVEVAKGASPELLQAARATTMLSLGEEPERVSVADYQRLWSGTDYLMPEGYGTLVARYGADVPVQLGTPVTAVRWDGAGVTVETPRGSIAARTAVITVPVGVLHAGAIRFVPDLPATTQQALHGLSMGALTKIALLCDGERLGFPTNTDLFEVSDPRTQTNVELWPFQRPLAVFMLGGDHARAWCRAGEREAVAHARDLLVSMLGNDARRHILRGHLAGWWTDPFAHGSYSIAAPGHMAAREALAEPVGERLWFAGEATAGAGAMTVGGATLEGQRAARAIVSRRAG